MKIDLSNKTALVTGGSKGIGKGCAQTLSEAGATVVICARNQQELEQTASEIASKTGNAVRAIVADVTDQQSIDELMKSVKAEFGSVDILVNNAGGIGSPASFEDLPAEDYLKLYDLNVISMIRFIKAVLPGMRQNKWGRIINISSENGLQPYPDMINYDLTKAAVINLSKAVSKLTGKDGILVNTVSPAFIYTPLVENMLKSQADGRPVEEVKKEFLETKRPNIELGRPGTIEEVGAAVVFLASEQASFITGTNLRVDGGSVAAI